MISAVIQFRVVKAIYLHHNDVIYRTLRKIIGGISNIQQLNLIFKI